MWLKIFDCFENRIRSFFQDFGEFFFFFFREVAEDEVGIAQFGTESVVVSAEAEAGEVFCAEMLDDGFEAVVAASGAFLTGAKLAEGEVEIVTDGEDVGGRDFIEVGESADGEADVVVESLGFDEEGGSLFAPDGVEFCVGFPSEMVDFEVEIERKEAEVMAGEVVFLAWVTEGDDEIHERIIAELGREG